MGLKEHSIHSIHIWYIFSMQVCVLHVRITQKSWTMYASFSALADARQLRARRVRFLLNRRPTSSLQRRMMQAFASVCWLLPYPNTAWYPRKWCKHEPYVHLQRPFTMHVPHINSINNLISDGFVICWPRIIGSFSFATRSAGRSDACTRDKSIRRKHM